MAPPGYKPFLQHAAAAYGFNSAVLDQLASLESGRNPTSVNSWDSNAAAGHPSTGIVQFIPSTFEAYSKQAKAANPAAWSGVPRDTRNWKAQLLTASWAMANGKGSAWSTFDRAKAAANPSWLTRKPGPAQAAPAPSSATLAPQAGQASDLGSAKRRAALDVVFGDNPRLRTLVGIAQDQADQRNTRAAAVTQPQVKSAAATMAAPHGGYKSIEAWANQLTGTTIPHTVGQETGGKHAANSYHYSGRAVDFGDATTTPAQFNAIAAAARQNPGAFKELYFNPLGWGIRNGKIIQGLTVAGHDDHMHIAV